MFMIKLSKGLMQIRKKIPSPLFPLPPMFKYSCFKRCSHTSSVSKNIKLEPLRIYTSKRIEKIWVHICTFFYLKKYTKHRTKNFTLL